MNLNHIKKLREETGLGMLEVKKALQEAHDDLEQARIILNQQTTNKESSARVASKGLTGIVTKGDQAILFEVNAETDFVSKHPSFIEMMDVLGTHLMSSKAMTVQDAKRSQMGDVIVEDYINKIAHLVKENVYLRRFHRIKKQSFQTFYTYKHQGGKLSVLLITSHVDDDIGKKIAMHIASHGPKYLSFDELDQNTIDDEVMMLKKEGFIGDQEEVNTYLRGLSLLDQVYLFDPQKRVKDVLSGLKIIDFYRFELGQGIENKLNCRLDIPCDGSTITVTPSFRKGGTWS